MNKISALESYKVSIVIDEVSRLSESPPSAVRHQAQILGQVEAEHGRGDDRTDERGNHQGHGRAEGTRAEVRHAGQETRRAQGPQPQAGAH